MTSPTNKAVKRITPATTAAPCAHTTRQRLVIANPSKDSSSFEHTQTIRIEGLRSSTYLVRAEDGVEDLSTYYWKVLAIDPYGAIRESEVGLFYTDYTNPVLPAWILGHVFDASTGLAIDNASVTAGSELSFSSDAGGYFLGQVPAGRYQLTATAQGYIPTSYATVDVGSGEVLTRNFALEAREKRVDLNGDGEMDLKDAILCLKVLTNQAVSIHFTAECDVNDDGRIGLEETIYILSRISTAE